MLSIYAGCYIGGNEKAGTGTRCPVAYTFVNGNEEIYKCGGKVCRTIRDLQNAITTHMLELGDDFSLEELPVFIQSRTATDGRVIDIPGLLPDQADPNNDVIKAMIAQYAQSKNTLPIIFTSPNQAMDPTYNESDARRLKEALGNDNALLSEAVILVTFLDRFKGQDDITKFRPIQQTLLRQFGLPPASERIIFLTLRPDLLRPDDQQEEEPKNEARLWAYKNTLIEKALEFEDTHLQSYVERLGAVSCSFGIRKAMEMILQRQYEFLLRNQTAICFSLTRGANDLQKRYVAVTTTGPSYRKIGKEGSSYVSLVCHALRCFTEAELPELEEQFRKHNVWIEDGKIGAYWKRLNLLFRDCKNAAMESPSMSAKSATFAEVAMAEIPEDHTLKISHDSYLSTGAAVKRVNQAFKYWAIARPLQASSVQDVLNLAGLLSGNGIRELSSNKVTQKMVRTHMGDLLREAYIACSWAVDIYERVFELVMEMFDRETTLLKAFPRLRAKINADLKRFHGNIFQRISLRCRNKIFECAESEFSHFSMSKLESMYRLLACCNIPDVVNMLQKDPALSLSPTKMNAFKRFFGGDSVTDANEDTAEMSLFEGLNNLVSSTAPIPDYVCGGSMKLLQFDEVMLVRKIDDLNAFTSAVTKFTSGLTADAFENIIADTLVGKAGIVGELMNERMQRGNRRSH
jgi:hypothetical protein